MSSFIHNRWSTWAVQTMRPQPSRRGHHTPGGTMLASRTRRPTIICALACALFAFAISGATAAGANEQARLAAALAQERYYMSYGQGETIDGGTSAAPARANERTQSARALAQERYYSSYGEPTPLSVARSPMPSDDTPWLPIALSAAAALAIAAASASQLHRLRIRRRAARVTT